MTRHSSPLEGVRVAAPCPADWDKMVGDERIRFCHQCELNVYNLSGMSKREAEALVANAEGRLCVRFYRRADGTILTNNCPVGLRALKRRVSRVVNATLSAALGFFAGLGLAPAPVRRHQATVGMMVSSPRAASEPFVPTPDVSTPPPSTEKIVMGQAVVGRMAPVRIEKPTPRRRQR